MRPIRTRAVVSVAAATVSPALVVPGALALQVGQNGQRRGEYGWSTARSFLCDSTHQAARGCTAAQNNTWLPIDLALDGGSGGKTSQVYPQPGCLSGPRPTVAGLAPSVRRRPTSRRTHVA